MDNFLTFDHIRALGQLMSRCSNDELTTIRQNTLRYLRNKSDYVRPPHIKKAKQIVSKVFPDTRVQDPEIQGGTHHHRHRGPYAKHARRPRHTSFWLPPLLQNDPAAVGVVLLVVLAALVSGIAMQHNHTKPAKAEKYAPILKEPDYADDPEDAGEDDSEAAEEDGSEAAEEDGSEAAEEDEEEDDEDADAIEKKRNAIVATIESSIASERVRDEVLFNRIKNKMPHFRNPAQFSVFLDGIQADAMPILLAATDDRYYGITSGAAGHLRERDLPLLGRVLDLQNALARFSVIDSHKIQNYTRELYIAERYLFEMDNPSKNIEALVDTISGNVNSMTTPILHDYSWLLGDKALTSDFLSYVENNAKIIYDNRSACDATHANMAYLIIDGLSNHFTMNARNPHTDPRRLRHLLILIGVSRYWARMTSC